MATTETSTNTPKWFGKETVSAEPEISDAQRAASEGSVRALVADLRYIMGNEEASRWPTLASAALEHHSPEVPSEHLAPEFQALQSSTRSALEGLCKSNFKTIRDSILGIRSAEARISSR